MTEARKTVDTLISGAVLVTMDDERQVISDGAVAIDGNRIAAIGKTREVLAACDAKTHIDGSRFVITPGLVNGHIHITGDPLTRAWLPDNIDADFEEELTHWVLPRFFAHEAADEEISAELSALKMLRTGTTCFVEAGTVQHLDAVVTGLRRTGIRGRVGAWVEGHDLGGELDSRQAVDIAIARLEREVANYPGGEGQLISAWPILVGHSTNPDDVWRCAKELADSHGLVVAAHMSPYASDPEWFQERYGRRPIEHLADIGVLGRNVCLTHVAHIDESEQALLAESGTNVVFCPLAALKGVFGLADVGRFPEMASAGINLMLGSDGFDQDMLRQAQLVSSLFKDLRRDVTLFPAESMLEMLTVNGAAGLGLADEIGSLAVGKRADLVCHDVERPEWQPVIGVVNQLAWLVDGRSVHSVWVDGNRVIEDYRSTMIDETELYARAAASAKRVNERAGIDFISPWPVR